MSITVRIITLLSNCTIYYINYIYATVLSGILPVKSQKFSRILKIVSLKALNPMYKTENKYLSNLTLLNFALKKLKISNFYKFKVISKYIFYEMRTR